jgi:hypothetical protein
LRLVLQRWRARTYFVALARADLFQLVSLQYSSCCIGVIDYFNFFGTKERKSWSKCRPVFDQFFLPAAGKWRGPFVQLLEGNLVATEAIQKQLKPPT